MTATVTELQAREVLDCRGMPTVQVEIELDGRIRALADVPAGRSTGSYEAVELRDGGNRFGGYGVRRAVENIRSEIAAAVVGTTLTSLHDLDSRLITLDGTANKGRLGANALMGVSVAWARAAAKHAGLPFYRYLNAEEKLLPLPLVNLINGGKHASNDLDFQEFIIVPVGASNTLEALQWSVEVNLALGELLLARYGKVALNTGDEGGFAPPISDPREALEFLHAAVERAGHVGRFRYGLDCAATHLYDAQSRSYTVAGSTLDSAKMVDYYLGLIRDFDVVTIEDPLNEDDFDGFAELTRAAGVQIVGDDLFVTNPERLRRGIDASAANAVLLKVNQIGTLTEAMDVARTAFDNGYRVVVSERSGETEDAMISDLTVALGAGQIKTGAPVRGERTAKYNRLIRIEEQLGASARFPDDPFSAPR